MKTENILLFLTNIKKNCSPLDQTVLFLSIKSWWFYFDQLQDVRETNSSSRSLTIITLIITFLSAVWTKCQKRVSLVLFLVRGSRGNLFFRGRRETVELQTGTRTQLVLLWTQMFWFWSFLWLVWFFNAPCFIKCFGFLGAKVPSGATQHSSSLTEAFVALKWELRLKGRFLTWLIAKTNRLDLIREFVKYFMI